jgi:hypothetical protein
MSVAKSFLKLNALNMSGRMEKWPSCADATSSTMADWNSNSLRYLPAVALAPIASNPAWMSVGGSMYEGGGSLSHASVLCH